MIRYLLLLQFPFFFLTTLFAGLGVYWTAQSVIGFYVASLLVLALLHQVFSRIRERLSLARFGVVVFLGGLAIAVWVYRPLHLGVWDESSVLQALKLGTLGVVSLLASFMALELRSGKYSLVLALTVVGLLWIPALEYSLIALLFVGLTQAAALAFLPLEPTGQGPEARDTTLPSSFVNVALYTVLLASMALGGTIWDYQEDTRWAGHLALAFLAAALGALFQLSKPRHGLLAGVLLVSAACLVNLLQPEFLLHPTHAIGVGAALGSALAYLDQSRGPGWLINSTLFWVLGLILSLGFARHIAWADWRAILLAPLWILVLHAWPRRHQASPGDPGQVVV